MSCVGDDCYFYYYSTCTKGNDCPFRHCQLALGTETVCTLWRDGLCARANCKFRHMESRINRAHIACYWENQPGGCRKPHCVFFHKKLRSVGPSSEKKQSLILPVASNTSTPHAQLSPTPDVLPDSTKSFSPNNEQTAENQPLNSPSIPVEPLVVRLNDGEESDTESTTSTPVKNISNKISPFEQKMLKMSGFDEDRDFGIKTLEQLKMEKIHRESEHFYKPICDDPLLENNVMDMQIKKSLVPDRPTSFALLMAHTHFGVCRILERRSENLPCKRKLSDTSSSVVTCDNSSDDKLASSDLRDVIKKKRVEFGPEPKKRVISLKKSADVSNGDAASITITLDENAIKNQKIKERPAKESQKVEKPAKGNMDFRIKTLEEIRQEKSKKNPNLKMDEVVEKPPTDEEMTEEADPVSTDQSMIQAVKPKLKRPAREIYQVKSKNGLSPKRNHFSQGVVAKTLKLSLFPEKPLPTVQKMVDVSNSQPCLTENIQNECPDVSDHGMLKPKKRKISFENGHQELNNESEKSKVKNLEKKSSSIRSIQSFIRRRIVPNLQAAEYSNEIHSITDELIQQSSHSFTEAKTENTSSDLATDSSKVYDHEQSQVNGIDSTSYNVELPSNHIHQDNAKIEKTSHEFSSSNQTVPKTSSTTDDFDKILLAEECGLSLDDLDGSTDKMDDSIFLEIDKLLES